MASLGQPRPTFFIFHVRRGRLTLDTAWISAGLLALLPSAKELIRFEWNWAQ